MRIEVINCVVGVCYVSQTRRNKTIRVAKATFHDGSPIMRLRDTLGTLYDDGLFADLFPTRGQPAEAPWRLALVTVFQFMEDLSDRQAAQAARRCFDWKYALGLELTDPGFNFSVLSEFRSRVLAGQAEQRLLTTLLEQCKHKGWRNRRWEATDRFNSRAHGCAFPQPLGVGWRDVATRTQYAGGSGSRLGASSGNARVV
jgi:transposase